MSNFLNLSKIMSAVCESSENKSIPSFLVAPRDFKFAEVNLQLSVVDLCKAQTVEHFRLQPYFEAEKVGGTLDLLCKASGEAWRCLQVLLPGTDFPALHVVNNTRLHLIPFIKIRYTTCQVRFKRFKFSCPRKFETTASKNRYFTL